MNKLIILMLLATVAYGQVDTSKCTSIGKFSTSTSIGKFSTGTSYNLSKWISSGEFNRSSNTIRFVLGDKEFSIKVDSCGLQILYSKDTKPSEAVKEFFDWLKQYVQANYYIIEKKELNKLLEK